MVVGFLFLKSSTPFIKRFELYILCARSCCFDSFGTLVKSTLVHEPARMFSLLFPFLPVHSFIHIYTYIYIYMLAFFYLFSGLLLFFLVFWGVFWDMCVFHIVSSGNNPFASFWTLGSPPVLLFTVLFPFYYAVSLYSLPSILCFMVPWETTADSIDLFYTFHVIEEEP